MVIDVVVDGFWWFEVFVSFSCIIIVSFGGDGY